MSSQCNCGQLCQHSNWTRKDVEDSNKGLPKDKWTVPNWYRNTDAKSRDEAMGVVENITKTKGGDSK
jgi:hypothetical protein